MIIGRFAPSPSGRLHIGNIFCAMIGYLSSKSKGGKYIIRMEDLDIARCSKIKAQQMLNDLDWLGIEFDEFNISMPKNDKIKSELLKVDKKILNCLYQSERTSIYKCFERYLSDEKMIYPCFCSRAELNAVSAPHKSDKPQVYNGTCKGLTNDMIKKKTRLPSMRVIVPDENISFVDGCLGKYKENLKGECGDFIIKRSDGIYSYQLAVVVDDGLMGVNEVVRGNDLISSTARQIWFYKEFGFDVPNFYHIPLILDKNGKRLSKRDLDLDIGNLKNNMCSQKLVGILAFCAGIIKKPYNVSLKSLISEFCFEDIPKTNLLLPYLF